MNWRDLMTAPAEAGNPFTQITHNTQNPPPAGSSADIADIALEESAPEAPPDMAPAASLEPAAPAPNWHGLTLADLQAAAGPDWPEVRDRPAALEVWAGILRASDPDPSAPRSRSWLVAYADGSTERMEFDKPATLADVRHRRPVSVSIAPEVTK